jgi:hypothetical protein
MKEFNMSETNVPALCTNDGFDSPIAVDLNQVIWPGSIRLKWLDRIWTASDIQLPNGTRLLAMRLRRLCQHWQNGNVIEMIETEPLPSIEELNNSVPVAEWEIGVDGKPREPWQLTNVVYLLDVGVTGAKYTFANASGGSAVAWLCLKDRVVTMRSIKRAIVYPIVELQSRPYSKRFKKDRPHFEPVDWRMWSTAEAIPQLTKVSEPTTAEQFDDEIPF